MWGTVWILQSDFFNLSVVRFLPFFIVLFSSFPGDLFQQLDLHPPDHGHDGLASVPGHAAVIHLQGPRLHPRLLGHIKTKSGGT